MSNNEPDYDNLYFAPVGDMSSLNDCNEGKRGSDVLLSAVDKCKKLESENKELKTRLYNIWLECEKPFQEDNERVLIDRLAYILFLSSVFEEKELDK